MTSHIKSICSILFCFLLALSTFLAKAESVRVSVEMDSTYVTFGCPMTFHLQAIVPEGQQVLFPQDILKKGGIVAHDDSTQYLLELDTFKPLQIDTVSQSNGIVTLREDVTVFAFDSAALYIPPFPFVTENHDTLFTNSLALKVFVPFQQVEVDPAKFVGLKDVEDPPFVFTDYLIYFLIPILLLVLAVAAFYGYRYYQRKHQQKEKEEVQVVYIPPYTEAMQALEALNERKLWQNGQDKTFHSELSDILRRYIERQMGVSALEQTTEQILDNLYQLAESQKASLSSLQQVLQMADLVKFAKYHPFSDENQLSFVNARMFVEQTKKSDDGDIVDASHDATAAPIASSEENTDVTR